MPLTLFSDSLNLRTVCNELGKVQHKAYEIGIQLGIPHSKLMEFEKSNRLLPTAVDYWLSGNVPDVPITWASVVAALKSEQVGETGRAMIISTKYCCQHNEPNDDKGESDKIKHALTQLSDLTSGQQPIDMVDLRLHLYRGMRLLKDRNYPLH